MGLPPTTTTPKESTLDTSQPTTEEETTTEAQNSRSDEDADRELPEVAPKSNHSLLINFYPKPANAERRLTMLMGVTD